MKFLPLIWAGLWRKKARTFLTVGSLVMAFLLLGLLQAANALLRADNLNLSAPILIVQERVSFTTPLPLRLLPQIEAVPGVIAVSFSQFFGGIYKDPQNFFPQFATNPDRWAKVFPECKLPPDQFAAWKTSRTAVVAGRQLAERWGWKLGERIPLLSQIWPQKDGTRAWQFDLVGIFDDAIEGSCPRLGNMYINYDYFDEARQFGQGSAGIYVVRIADLKQAEAIGQQIDAMFENSPDETKTQSERDFTLNFARQLGNLNLILTMIMVSVFFSILMLTGNTMRQAVADRVPELAVLKTLGFTDLGLLALVLSESLLMCVLGGLLGMGLAQLVMFVLGRSLQNLPPLEANASVWGFAAGAMLLLAFLIGILPALRAKRLSIVEALANR